MKKYYPLWHLVACIMYALLFCNVVFNWHPGNYVKLLLYVGLFLAPVICFISLFHFYKKRRKAELYVGVQALFYFLAVLVFAALNIAGA